MKFSSLIASAFLCVSIAGAIASAQTLRPTVMLPAQFAVTQPLRDIQQQEPVNLEEKIDYREPLPRRASSVQLPDTVLQSSPGPLIDATGGTHFDGLGANGFSPSDDNMAVGKNPSYNYILQTVNSRLGVYTKSGGLIFGPNSLSSLWGPLGPSNGCATNNAGDVVSQYDTFADRWLITQLGGTSSPYSECIAVSQTPDPTGAYYLYSFAYTTTLNDYPKFGVWPTTANSAYTATYNLFANGSIFTGAQLCAYDRTKMLAGDPSAAGICYTITGDGGFLPADLDGATAPLNGTPAYFLTYETSPSSSLRMYALAPNFSNPILSTLTQIPPDIGVAPFTEPCSNGGGPCVPQSGTSQQLDSLGDRPMYRLAFRNFGDHQALVVNHSIANGTGVAVRWYELRAIVSNSATFTLYQQGTFAPDAVYRWMGSMAMDGAGNIGLGYSASSSAIHPGVRYTGRTPSDALGIMETEASIMEGAGSQNGNLDRWGDYSALRIDPADDCTLWYTTEYLKSDGRFNWSTVIGSFRFNSCGPSAVSVAPNSGTGQTQTFNAVYIDPNGALDLSVAYLDFGTSVFAPNSCIVAYVRSSNLLFLANDASSGTVPGSLVPGGSGTLTNSQCTLSGAGGNVTVAGNNLTVPFNITFAGGFGGSKNVYGFAQSNSGANGGWPLLGTWTPPASAPPNAVSVTPNSGLGQTQTFNALFSDPNGATDLNVAYLDFGTSVFAPNSCIVAYVRSSNLLFLANDASSGTVPGSITPGGSGTLTNSQCTLSGAGGAVTVAGNNLTVPFKITFLGGFTGLKNIYGLAQNNSGANSGWPLLGTWTPQTGGMSLGAVSVSPNSGFGQTQTFSALYTDPSGASDLYVVYLDIGGSVFAPNSCIVAYLRSSNMLYLVNDASNATVPGSIVPGGSGTLSNSQCTLSGVGGPVTVAGNNLTVPFAITFAGGFAGTKNVYGLAQNNSGANGGWPLLGTWTTVIGGPPLGAVSVSPNSGTGLTQTFYALYADPSGPSDLYVVYLDFGASAFAPNSCIVAYLRSSNTLYLINDASNATVPGSIVPGGGGTLTNGQCTLSGAGGTVTAAGNNLTVPFNITFSGGFTGSKSIFGLAQNNANANGGWQNLGNWTP